jgi:hypothetical protein
MGFLGNPIGLEIGKTYVVNCDGIDYEVIAIDASVLSGGEITGVFMVNLAMFGANDNGMPFMIMESPVENIVMIAHIDFSVNHTFSIYEKEKIIHKLDNRCLDLDWIPTVTSETYIEKRSVLCIYERGSVKYGPIIPIIDITQLVGKTVVFVLDDVQHIQTVKHYQDDISSVNI